MSSANIIREMGFVKGFRLKNLSPRVKPLNLRGAKRPRRPKRLETKET